MKSGVSIALGDDETAAANEREGEVLAERTPLDFSKRKLPYTVYDKELNFVGDKTGPKTNCGR